MPTKLAPTLLALGMLAGPARSGWAAADGQEATPEREAPSTPGETFEAIASAATRTNDVTTLMAPFFERCESAGREIDRTRCLVSQGYLRRVLPGRSFLMTADDPAAIAVSDYDGGIKGYRLTLSACVACSKPIAVGPAGERRFVTLRTPEHGADTLPNAVAVLHSAAGFETLPEAKRWLADVRPTLRAELIFKPVQSEWSFGTDRGYALEFLAGRIYNRCTGDVLASRPPSTGRVEVSPTERLDEGCTKPAAAAAGGAASPGAPGTGAGSGQGVGDSGDGAGDGDERLPAELSKSAIAESMSQIRAQVFACYQKYQVPGNVQLTYEVASNGLVQSIHLSGSLDGTPTGVCVLDAGKNARFPRFGAPTQKFSYPFFLRK